MDLQPLDQFVDYRDARQHRRHDDDGAEFAQYTIAKLKPGKHRGTEPVGDRSVHQRDRGINGNKEAQNRQR